MTSPPKTVALYGVRCSTPAAHFSDGRIYATSRLLVEMTVLAKDTCYEVVVSHDGGTTWQPYTQQQEASR